MGNLRDVISLPGVNQKDQRVRLRIVRGKLAQIWGSMSPVGRGARIQCMCSRKGDLVVARKRLDSSLANQSSQKSKIGQSRMLLFRCSLERNTSPWGLKFVQCIQS